MARRSRQEQVGQFAQVKAQREAGRSERELSKQLKIPRSTVQRWRRRQLAEEVPVALAQFLESEEGLQWLHRQDRSAFEAQTPRPPGRPPAFEPRIVTALLEHKEAEAHCRQAEEQQQQARQVVQTLGEAYHPYDLRTGQAQPVEQVAKRFQDCWDQLSTLAKQADLPQRARERIAKAQRMTASLLATLTFFFTTIQAKVEALALAPEIEAALHQQLIPAIYLERVADRSSRADERHALRQLSHRLSERKLSALTAVHNYFIRRPDGTTAAQRFFGQKHPPMFGFLLTYLKPPPRPAQKRPRPQRAPYLAPVAVAA